MNIIEPDSSFSISVDYSLSETDFSVLALLYLPIIKSDAYLIYDVLYKSSKSAEIDGLATHEEFLSMIGFDDVRFLKARERLEAIGLLETYRKEKTDENGSKVFYLYRLIPTASPKKFFADPILKNLLLQNVSNKKYHRLVNYFKKEDGHLLDGFNSVSARFSDVYSVALSEEDLQAENNVEGKQYKEIAKFSMQTLLDFLQADNIPLDKIHAYFSQIESDAKLYGLDEKTVLKLIEESLDTDFNFYLNKFESKVRTQNQYIRLEKQEAEKASLGQGDSSVNVKIFTSTTPKQYLQAFFHAEPNDYMLKEVEKLRRNFDFDNGIINVILDYSLKKTNKEFNSVLIDKVAFTLSANNVTDCYGAIVALKTRDFQVLENKIRKSTYSKVKKSAAEETDIKEESEEITKDDLLALSKGLDL